jgi:hypothetical protein
MKLRAIMSDLLPTQKSIQKSVHQGWMSHAKDADESEIRLNF